MFHPQGNFYGQGTTPGYPQTGFGQSNFGFGQQGYPGLVPFSNLTYGYPQGGIGQQGPWQQQQDIQQPHHQLQRLAHYYYSVAQQLAQLAVHQAAQHPGNPYAGQFTQGTGQLGSNPLGNSFVPGITMH